MPAEGLRRGSSDSEEMLAVLPDGTALGMHGNAQEFGGTLRSRVQASGEQLSGIWQNFDFFNGVSTCRHCMGGVTSRPSLSVTRADGSTFSGTWSRC